MSVRIDTKQIPKRGDRAGKNTNIADGELLDMLFTTKLSIFNFHVGEERASGAPSGL